MEILDPNQPPSPSVKILVYFTTLYGCSISFPDESRVFSGSREDDFGLTRTLGSVMYLSRRSHPTKTAGRLSEWSLARSREESILVSPIPTPVTGTGRREDQGRSTKVSEQVVYKQFMDGGTRSDVIGRYWSRYFLFTVRSTP